jgi:hypothetical protein
MTGAGAAAPWRGRSPGTCRAGAACRAVPAARSRTWWGLALRTQRLRSSSDSDSSPTSCPSASAQRALAVAPQSPSRPAHVPPSVYLPAAAAAAAPEGVTALMAETALTRQPGPPVGPGAAHGPGPPESGARRASAQRGSSGMPLDRSSAASSVRSGEHLRAARQQYQQALKAQLGRKEHGALAAAEGRGGGHGGRGSPVGGADGGLVEPRRHQVLDHQAGPEGAPAVGQGAAGHQPARRSAQAGQAGRQVVQHGGCRGREAEGARQAGGPRLPLLRARRGRGVGRRRPAAGCNGRRRRRRSSHLVARRILLGPGSHPPRGDRRRRWMTPPGRVD